MVFGETHGRATVSPGSRCVMAITSQNTGGLGCGDVAAREEGKEGWLLRVQGEGIYIADAITPGDKNRPGSRFELHIRGRNDLRTGHDARSEHNAWNYVFRCLTRPRFDKGIKGTWSCVGFLMLLPGVGMSSEWRRFTRQVGKIQGCKSKSPA